ncbi:MAG: AAA family ATPase, partial [Staphylothermus sp.]|nr:AAA family ATPase [Staphylothermus sp.]
MTKLIIGIEELDRLLPTALYPGATVVVAGHPGAGKTTLAITICYSNALRNKKCLYISFQEAKPKLYRVMKSLGMDLEKLERMSLYKFVNLPITSASETIATSINKLLADFRPDIVVIDSINAVLEGIKDPSRRAWLQNYFYQLADMINGLAIIVSELPFGEDQLNVASISFVSDALLILKHYIRGGKLVRILEIRKARGSPIRVAEIPFQIREGEGIKVFIPPALEQITSQEKSYSFSMDLFKAYMGEINAGSHILMVMSSYARNPFVYLPVIDLALTNNLKALLISYRYSLEELKTIFEESFKDIIDKKLLKKFLEKQHIIEGINPYGMSTEEIMMAEMELIEKHDPDIVVFHGTELLLPEMETDVYR